MPGSSWIDRPLPREPFRTWRHVKVPEELFCRLYSPEEHTILRPIAETLAMLDGKSLSSQGQCPSYHLCEYLPIAYFLFEWNGGTNGWAGQASWVRDRTHKNLDVRDAYETYWTLKNLTQEYQSR